jgi:beta-phosphoglucomutase
VPRSIAAIIFDFDGVIVHSEPLHFRAFRETLAPEGIDLPEVEYYAEMIGFDDRGAFAHILQKHGKPIDPKMLLRLMARKSQMVRQLIDRRQYAALPGVEELVRGLWRWGFARAPCARRSRRCSRESRCAIASPSSSPPKM